MNMSALKIKLIAMEVAKQLWGKIPILIRTEIESAVSALSYFCVSAISAWCGYCYNPESFELSAAGIAFVALFLCWFFIAWNQLFDKDNNYTYVLKKQDISNIQIFLLPLVLIAFTFFVIWIANQKVEFDLLAIKLALTIAPFLILLCYYEIKKNSRSNDLDFSKVIFIPVFISVVFPFTYFYISINDTLSCCGVYAVLYIFLIAIFFAKNSKKTAIGGVIFYIICLLFSIKNEVNNADFHSGEILYNQLIYAAYNTANCIAISVTIAILLGLLESLYFIKNKGNNNQQLIIQNFKALPYDSNCDIIKEINYTKNLVFYEQSFNLALRFFPFFVPFLLINTKFGDFTILLIIFAIVCYFLLKHHCHAEKDKRPKPEWEFKKYQNWRLIGGFLLLILFAISSFSAHRCIANWMIVHTPKVIRDWIPDWILHWINYFIPELKSASGFILAAMAISLGILTVIRNSSVNIAEEKKAPSEPKPLDPITEIFSSFKIITLIVVLVLFLAALTIEQYTDSNIKKYSIHCNKSLNSNSLIEKLKKTQANIDLKRDSLQFDKLDITFENIDSSKMIFNTASISVATKQTFKIHDRALLVKFIYGILFIIIILGEPLNLIFKKVKSKIIV
jgi:hypothetical protein